MEMNCPAYCAPASWFRDRLMKDPEAYIKGLPIPPNRCVIIDRGKEVTLSVPIAGGAAVLKHEHDADRIIVSDHGDWRRVHRGAFTTAYSRTPFFLHYHHILEEAWELKNPSLRMLNETITDAIEKALHLRELAPALLSMPADPRFNEAAPLHVTMLDALFHYGPEAIFRLRAAL